jgi:hypothetical protein
MKNKTHSLAGVLPSLSLPPSPSLSFHRSAPHSLPAINFYRLIKRKLLLSPYAETKFQSLYFNWLPLAA